MWQIKLILSRFQSTHPYRVWRWCRGYYYEPGCFNPHTHTGCDFPPSSRSSLWPVSIHTPIQGVTQQTAVKEKAHVFQSTHPYRVWPSSSLLQVVMVGFQSTHPYRVWRNMWFYKLIDKSFNPHTHTGCDVRSWRHSLPSAVFQSTHPYRVWLSLPLLHVVRVGFQSTHPYRVWQQGSRLRSYGRWRFNPHTHTGCDDYDLVDNEEQAVSIHTPIQGVTELTANIDLGKEFQSTHPYRVWPGVLRLRPCQVKFQSTHPYRVWRLLAAPSANHEGFNPHTHTGCDIWLQLIISQSCSFNPHTHTGCDDRLFNERADEKRFNPHTHTGCDVSRWRTSTI